MLTTSPVAMPSPSAVRAPRATTASPVVTAARSGQLEPRLGRVQLLDRLDDAEGGPHRPLGVVLVSDGSAERGHHGIPDELLHGAAPPHRALV